MDSKVEHTGNVQHSVKSWIDMVKESEAPLIQDVEVVEVKKLSE